MGRYHHACSANVVGIDCFEPVTTILVWRTSRPGWLQRLWARLFRTHYIYACSTHRRWAWQWLGQQSGSSPEQVMMDMGTRTPPSHPSTGYLSARGYWRQRSDRH